MDHARQRGFTLVELIVTLSIMVIVLAVALVTTRQSTAKSRLRQTSDDVSQAIYTTHNLALAPAVDKTPGSDGYVFHLVGAGSTSFTGYEIREADVLNSQGQVTIPGRVIKHIDLPNTSHITTLPGPNQFSDLQFSITGQGKITSPQPPSGEVDLQVVAGAGPSHITLAISTITGQVATTESL